LYDYRCPDCGEFRAWRRMSEGHAPVDCPSCAGQAARAVVAPNLALMAGNRRIAHQRNEKSAHEPVVASGSQLPHGHGGGAHGGHGHSHGHGQRHGSGGRPWMIGH
jgi:putative FmdB family regulatory protein